MSLLEMLLSSDPTKLALLALVVVVSGPVAMLVMLGALVRRGIRIPLLDRRTAGNGTGQALTSKTRLNAMEQEWRNKLVAEVEQHRRALYDPDGAVRAGDRAVRDSVTAEVRELRTDMRDLREDIGGLREELGRHHREQRG